MTNEIPKNLWIIIKILCQGIITRHLTFSCSPITSSLRATDMQSQVGNITVE